MISDVDMVAARDDWNVSGLDPVVVRHGLLSLPDRAAAVCCAFHFAFLGYVWMLQAFNKCRICVDFSFCRFRGIQRINTPLSDPANVLEAVPLTCRKTVMKLVQDAIALASACTETDDAARWGGQGGEKIARPRQMMVNWKWIAHSWKLVWIALALLVGFSHCR